MTRKHVCCTDIDNEYHLACRSLATEPHLKVLERIAQAGADGCKLTEVAGHDSEAFWDLFRGRDSDSTLIRRVCASVVRTHHYPHALYLHGVKGPNEPNVEQKIKEVKEKFKMNTNSA